MIEIINSNQVERIQKIAQNTWPSTFKDILSVEQIDYMLDLMYKIETLKLQIISGHQYFIYAENNEDLGFMGIELNYPEPNNLKIHKIYVLPNAQGKGVGYDLLQKAVQVAKENSMATISLNVNKYNKAISFYEKQGFKIVKEEIIDIGNNYIMDDYVMTRVI